MGISKAFIAGAAKLLPNAAVAFVVFHVVQRTNKTVDAVRLKEARAESWFKKTRWCWIKDKAKWTAKVQKKMDWMLHSHRQTARA